MHTYVCIFIMNKETLKIPATQALVFTKDNYTLIIFCINEMNYKYLTIGGKFIGHFDNDNFLFATDKLKEENKPSMEDLTILISYLKILESCLSQL